MGTACDVLVIGGGSAGVAAAVAAARGGAKTVLVERHGVLGGMAPVALVHSICGLYLLREDPVPVFANPGFATEFATRLIDAGGAWGPQRMGRVDVLLQHPTAFAVLCDRMVGETPGLEVSLHTEVVAIRGGERIEAVEMICRGVRRTIEPKAVIDASGDGVTAVLGEAGSERAGAGQLQRPALIFSMQGVEVSCLERDGRIRLAAQLVAAVREGLLPRGALGAHFRATPRGKGEAFVTIDLDPPDGAYDPTDPACLTAMEMHGRDLADRLARYLREHVEGFTACDIASLPARVGVRESRRLVGRYRLEEEDILRGAEFDDAIGLGTWPMELRETTSGARLRFPREDRPCQIPLRALRSASVANLFMAGRCISASHEAQASIRVIGACFVTGEAAGLAAAIAAERGEVTAAEVLAARQRVMMRHQPVVGGVKG